MAIADFNHIKDVLDKLDLERPSRFGYTEAAVNATGAAEISALEGVFIIEDPTQINSIPTPDLIGVDPIVVNIGLRTQAATMSRMAISHFFGRLSLNLLKVTEKLKFLVDSHLVNRYITPSGDVMEDVTAGYTVDTITLVKHKSPLSASAPITSSSAISLLAAVYNGNAGVMTGADKKKLDDVDSNAVKLTGDQTVAGIKTFSSIPVLPALDPSTDNQAARKAYVDTKVQSLAMPVVDITDDTSLLTNRIYILNATVIKTLTLPATALKGDTIKIIDKGGNLFKVKRADNLTGTLIARIKKLSPSKFNEYFKSVSAYSVLDLICLTDNTEWMEQNLSDLVAVIGRGYVMGGHTGTTSATAVIEYIDFGTETSAPITATIDTAMHSQTGVDGILKGYVLGGAIGAGTLRTDIEYFLYSDETSAVITAVLNTAKHSGAGVSGTLKGYIMGGYTTTTVVVIEDIKYSDETSAPITATIDTARYAICGVYSALKGYAVGGCSAAVTGLNIIDDLIFDTETSTVLSATLDTAKGFSAGVSGTLKGYIMGGQTGVSFSSVTAIIEVLVYATEAESAIVATLNTAKSGLGGCAGITKGYVAGGGNSGGTRLAVIEDLNFSTESSDVITATLDTAKYWLSCVSGIN